MNLGDLQSLMTFYNKNILDPNEARNNADPNAVVRYNTTGEAGDWATKMLNQQSLLNLLGNAQNQQGGANYFSGFSQNPAPSAYSGYGSQNQLGSNPQNQWGTNPQMSARVLQSSPVGATLQNYFARYLR